MKHVFMFAAALFLTSCGGESPEEAAKEICECYNEAMTISEKLGSSESSEDLIQLSNQMNEAIVKGDKCKAEWDKQYNGNVDVAAFKKELKEENEKVYNMLNERGMFKN